MEARRRQSGRARPVRRWAKTVTINATLRRKPLNPVNQKPPAPIQKNPNEKTCCDARRSGPPTPAEAFRFSRRLYPARFGRTGVLTQTKEGDKRRPPGHSPHCRMLYRPDDIPAPVPWPRPSGPRGSLSMMCDTPDYNSRCTKTPTQPQHEALAQG